MPGPSTRYIIFTRPLALDEHVTYSPVFSKKPGNVQFVHAPPWARGVPTHLLSGADEERGGGGAPVWRNSIPPTPFKFTFSMGPDWVYVEPELTDSTGRHTSTPRSDPETHRCGSNHFVTLNIKQPELDKSRRLRLWGRCVCMRARACVAGARAVFLVSLLHKCTNKKSGAGIAKRPVWGFETRKCLRANEQAGEERGWDCRNTNSCFIVSFCCGAWL